MRADRAERLRRYRRKELIQSMEMLEAYRLSDPDKGFFGTYAKDCKAAVTALMHGRLVPYPRKTWD